MNTETNRVGGEGNDMTAYFDRAFTLNHCSQWPRSLLPVPLTPA
jgi:hypothetical protein